MCSLHLPTRAWVGNKREQRITPESPWYQKCEFISRADVPLLTEFHTVAMTSLFPCVEQVGALRTCLERFGMESVLFPFPPEGLERGRMWDQALGLGPASRKMASTWYRFNPTGGLKISLARPETHWGNKLLRKKPPYITFLHLFFLFCESRNSYNLNPQHQPSQEGGIPLPCPATASPHQQEWPQFLCCSSAAANKHFFHSGSIN